MKTAARHKPNPLPTLEAQYLLLFGEHVRHGDEAALRRAYELGRRGIAEKKSLIDVISLHHQALQATLSSVPGQVRRQELLVSASEFLTEVLSPYEMAHRGVQDAIAALRRFNETLEEEIKRIAYSVHDDAGQLLVAVHLALADLARELPQPQKEQVGRIEDLLNQVEKQLRRYSHELRPTVLDDLGWIPAIRFLAEGISKRANLKIRIQTNVSGRLAGPMEIALYRIVLEALTNASKHSKASSVWIRIKKRNKTLCCSIEDNGAGFDPKAVQADRKQRGLGLVGMQVRLNAIGGMLSIDSAPGKGTCLTIQLPLEASNADSHRPG